MGMNFISRMERQDRMNLSIVHSVVDHFLRGYNEPRTSDRNDNLFRSFALIFIYALRAILQALRRKA